MFPKSHCALLSCSVMSDFVTPWTVAHQAPLSMGPGYSSGLPHPPPGDPPNLRIEPRFPALWADSLPSEPPERPKNIGMGSLYLLQGNFPTPEMKWGLLCCRKILYQLSYLGSPWSLVIGKVIGYFQIHPGCDIDNIYFFLLYIVWIYLCLP